MARGAGVKGRALELRRAMSATSSPSAPSRLAAPAGRSRGVPRGPLPAVLAEVAVAP